MQPLRDVGQEKGKRADCIKPGGDFSSIDVLPREGEQG